MVSLQRVLEPQKETEDDPREHAGIYSGSPPTPRGLFAAGRVGIRLSRVVTSQPNG
jgi:hypothetical protein